ncbi:MAG: type II restriction endonuclease [Campylobacterales bacterium]|nr:type II restriction endonuclease [Campylobacterales bacterium]
MNKQEIGSMTAKGGFINEADICDKFLNYETDKDAQSWLLTMGYEPTKIQSLIATQIPVRINKQKALSLGVLVEKYEETIKFKKADIQIKIEITIDHITYIENISLKKANKSAGFNQVDKRPVLTYQQLWNFDDDIAQWLRAFTGDILPKDILAPQELKSIKDKRRLFLNEIPNDKLTMITEYFEQNKTLIISDILRGRGGLSAEWFLVARKNSDTSIDWILKDINSVCNFYAQGDVSVTPRGSLKIDRVTMQRKGGTPDPTSLQFKINPLALFEVE